MTDTAPRSLGRTCSSCGQELTTENTHRRTLSANGYNTRCIACVNAQKARRRAAARPVDDDEPNMPTFDEIGAAIGLTKWGAFKEYKKALAKLRAGLDA